MRIIVDRWAWLSKADLSVSQLAALRRNLTVVPKKYDLDREDPKPLHLFTETHSMFGVAREYALGNLKPHHQVELNVSNGDKSTWPGLLNFCGVLRPEQDQAVTQIATQFMQGTDLGGLLQASPGFGKTVCASALMARLQVPTLVVVHKEFLMSQWQQRLTQFLPGIQIGICQQDVLDYHGKHVVIGMVHTLADRTFSDEFIRWPGLVITDEVHRVGAATWSVVPSRFPARWRFGITATPRRKDGAEKVFQFHIGRILFAAKEQRMRPKIKRVHTTFRVVPTPNMSVGKMPRTLLVTLMCASPARTALIANQAVLAVQAGRKVLLLSERLGHLESIHKTIVRLWPAGAGALPSIDYYVGGRTEAERTVAAKATVILATSQFASEALDIPALDTLILSTPMSDVEQAVGRILRPSVGKKEPIVVDIRDDRVPLFKAFGDKRDRLYEKIA